MKGHRFNTAFCIAFLVLAGFLVYANSLAGTFLFDDDFIVRDNAYIAGASNVGKIFKSNLLAGAGQPSVFYRPLQTLTYCADHSVWKLNPFGYHLTNVALHVLAGVALFWFLRILSGSQALAFLAALFFEIHPVHTEAVSYVSGRADPLVFVFLILTFILYLKQMKAPNFLRYILMLLTYGAALMSRENSIVLPALILVYHACFKQKLRAKEFLSLSALLCLYLVVRATVLKDMLSQISSDTSLSQRWPGAFVALLQYLRLLVLPLGLHMEYGKHIFSPWDPRVWGGAVFCGTLFYIIFRKNFLSSIARFSIAWFLISFLPVSNLFPINATMAEHWLYLPSVGFFLLLALFLKRFYEDPRHRTAAVVCAAVLALAYSFLTVRQNLYWRNPASFYTRTLAYAPQSSKVLNNLGTFYKAQGDLEKSISFFQRAVAANPRNTEAHYNLGNVYAATSRPEEAVASYQRALALNPNRADIYNNLGNAYLALGKNDLALACYQKALACDPRYVEAANNLSVVYSNLGRKKEAIDLLREVIRENPLYATAYKNLAVFYYETQEYDLAVRYADQAAKLGAVLPPTFLKALEPLR